MKNGFVGSLGTGIFILISLFSYPQDHRKVIDTIEFQGKTILMFENNSWEEIPAIVPLVMDSLLADTMSLFTLHWDNKSIYAYLDSSGRKPLPDTTIVVLADDQRQFVLPCYGKLYSGFGWRSGRTHDGLDIDLDNGDPVKAAFDGKVRYAKYHRNGYGKLVIIRHFNGTETYYAHLSSIYVKEDQMVKAGQIIGAGGATGSTYRGAHLHFEMRWCDRPFDPLSAIDFENESLFSDTLCLTPASFKATQPAKAARNIQILAQQNPELLPPEKNLEVNTDKTTPAGNADVHIVKRGDCLYNISKYYHVSIDELCRINNITPSSVLRIGQKIKLN